VGTPLHARHIGVYTLAADPGQGRAARVEDMACTSAVTGNVYAALFVAYCSVRRPQQLFAVAVVIDAALCTLQSYFILDVGGWLLGLRLTGGRL